MRDQLAKNADVKILTVVFLYFTSQNSNVSEIEELWISKPACNVVISFSHPTCFPDTHKAVAGQKKPFQPGDAHWQSR